MAPINRTTTRSTAQGWSVRLFPVGVPTLLATFVLGVAPAKAQEGVGFRFTFGHQEVTGDLGEVLDGAVESDFSILVPVSAVRVGGGANWTSFPVIGEQASWSQVRLHALFGYALPTGARVRPYGEARITFRRLRPEDDRFFGSEEEELLRDFVASGISFEAVLGGEISLSRRLSADVSAALSPFSVSPDLDEEGLGPLDSGTTWSLRAGVSWYPVRGG